MVLNRSAFARMYRGSFGRSRALVAGLAVLVVGAVPMPSGADEPVRLRVLSYNIRYGMGLDDRFDLQRIADVINAVEPDLVSLQEVDRGVERSGRIDEPAELARLTGTEWVFDQNIPHQGGDYGNAVLSKLPIVAQRNVHLPNLDDGEQRGCLVVDVAGPGDSGTIRVLATHLDHRPGDSERLASAALIEEIVAEEPDRPTILMGDLNALPEGATLRRFDATWTRTNDEPLPTHPADGPKKQIDYILTRPAGRWRVVEVRVIDEPVASDHRPIFAVLELVEGEE